MTTEKVIQFFENGIKNEKNNVKNNKNNSVFLEDVIMEDNSQLEAERPPSSSQSSDEEEGKSSFYEEINFESIEAKLDFFRNSNNYGNNEYTEERKSTPKKLEISKFEKLLKNEQILEKDFDESARNNQDGISDVVDEHPKNNNFREIFKRFEDLNNNKNESSIIGETKQPPKKLNKKVGMLNDFFEHPLEKQDTPKQVKIIQKSPPSIKMSSPDACAFCEKKVYVMEKIEANSKMYHKTCFRCSVCKCVLRLDAFTFHHGALYCKNHFKQLFKVKGNYDEGFGFETQKQIFEKKKMMEGGQ